MAKTLAALGKLLQNEYCTIIQTLQSTINFSRNKFYDFLPDIDINYFSLSSQLIIERLKILICPSIL